MKEVPQSPDYHDDLRSKQNLRQELRALHQGSPLPGQPEASDKF